MSEPRLSEGDLVAAINAIGLDVWTNLRAYTSGELAAMLVKTHARLSARSDQPRTTVAGADQPSEGSGRTA